ncbi:MAG: zinc-binding dehydrogenase [Lentisphaerae bacterium]|nr:zinc-binding dehydrogenase [Lentisphaerota bacterium]
MKALQIVTPGEVRVRDIPAPVPAPHEVLVKVMEVNTCPQWDMHVWQGVTMLQEPLSYPYTPGQPGHEMAGVVADAGRAVTAFKPGDRVAAWRDPGHRRQGCYAQYVAFDAADLLRIPPEAAFSDYASLELAMCVGASFLDILRSAPIRGRRFGVGGLGGAGLIAAQLARAEGAGEIIGFELNPARAAFALDHGVDRVFDPAETPPDTLGPGAVDISLDCVGARASAEYLLTVTQHIVAIFGVQREPFVYPCVNRNLKLFGYPGHSREAAAYAFDRIISGRLTFQGLVGARLGLEQYAQGVRMLLDQEAIKVCFLPNG